MVLGFPRSRAELRASELRAMWRARPSTVAALERELAAVVGVPHAVAMPSARVGLDLALAALGARRGDEIVLSALNYPPLVARLRRAGMCPVPVDVASGSLLPSCDAIAAACGPRTAAVVVTHAFGRPAPLEAVRALCDRRGLALVEDCAQALGAKGGGRSVGTAGDAALFSFGPTKPLGAIGGGAVVCRDGVVAQALAHARDRLPEPHLGRAARSARAAAFAILTQAHGFAFACALASRAPDEVLGAVLSDPPGHCRRRVWQDVAMAPPEATLVRMRLAELDLRTRARRAAHEDLLAALERASRGHASAGASAWRDPEGSIGFGVLLQVPAGTASAASALLRRRVDAARGELGNVGGSACPNAAALERDLARLPVDPALDEDAQERLAAATVSAYGAVRLSRTSACQGPDDVRVGPADARDPSRGMRVAALELSVASSHADPPPVHGL